MPSRERTLEELNRMSDADLDKPIIARMNASSQGYLTGRELRDSLLGTPQNLEAPPGNPGELRTKQQLSDRVKNLLG